MESDEAMVCERCGGETLRIVYGYPREATGCRAPGEQAPGPRRAIHEAGWPTRKCRACGHRQGLAAPGQPAR